MTAARSNRAPDVPLPLAGGDGVVGMQAFCMFHAQLEGRAPFHLPKRLVQASGGVFAEHQVLPVGQGEGLLVRTFHRGLHSCPQACLNAVDQLGDG